MIDLRLGDCRDVLKTLADASVDSVVTDPPYELGFMGKPWDGSGIAYDVGMWREVLRVLKPGGHLLAFGGSRTYHRLACAVEDAGFEIRDQIMWLYGSGFPKSLDVGKAIDRIAPRVDMLQDRYALARHIRQCRQAKGLSVDKVNALFGYVDGCQHWERQDRHGHRVPSLADWIVLREQIGVSDEWLPLIERIEAEREVVGAREVAIDKWTAEGRRRFDAGDEGTYTLTTTAPATEAARRWQGWGTALKPAHEPIVVARRPLCGTVAENVLAFGTGAINVDGCRVATDENLNGGAYSGTQRQREEYSSTDAPPGAVALSRLNRGIGEYTSPSGRWPANVILSWPEDEYALRTDITAEQRKALYGWLSENA